MKLKLRVNSKDITVFIAFALVLFYLVAIAVLNIAKFASTQELHGLNPLPAFTSEYIFPTLVFFIGALIVIISSVSSVIFERKKGVGIEIADKEESGYSRWSKDKEMKKELKMVLPTSDTSDVAGIPLMNDGKEIWVDNSDYHSLIIGSTGSGKTEMLVQPMVRVLAKKGESMIITDPKGEIFEKNAAMLREKDYNVVLLNFRDPLRGNSWNPMYLPYSLYKDGNIDKSIELLEDLAANILHDPQSKSQDPFWENTSADYFAGLSCALFEDAKPEEINLNSISLMTTAGEEKFMGTTYIKDYFSYKEQSSTAYTKASSTLMAPTETKGSILSVFKQKIQLFASRANLSEMLSNNDFDMRDIGRKKTAVFIVIQDEKTTYHSLVTIFLKQCYETLIDVAQENGGKLTYRTNFILDEFANMPPLKDVTTMVTAARSRKIRFNFIIQNFAQLYQVYGKENGETIKGNCGNIVYLISSELSALEELSKMCGEVKSKEKEKTSSTPLVTVSDLQRMKEGSMVLIRTRCMPFKTKLKYDWQMRKEGLWEKEYEKAEYPTREKHSVELFDLKKYVELKREEKMKSMMGNMDSEPIGGNPMFSGMPMFGERPNPFTPKPNSFEQNNGSTPSGGFNIDDLVKRIDAKIAELEEEEKIESEKPKEIPDTKLDNSTDDIFEPEDIIEEVSKDKLNETKDEHKQDISDDQFFDDFFNDE